MTVQDFFLRYKKLAGMTGTASSDAAELKRVYKVNVFKVPTNRPGRRVWTAARIEQGEIVDAVGRGVGRALRDDVGVEAHDLLPSKGVKQPTAPAGSRSLRRPTTSNASGSDLSGSSGSFPSPSSAAAA